MKDKLTRERAIEIARSYKERLGKAGVPIDRMILFGSAALDMSDMDSDIDIVIVGPAFRRTRLEEAVVCRKATWDIDRRIEPICMRPGNIDNKYLSLASEIRRKGVEV